MRTCPLSTSLSVRARRVGTRPVEPIQRVGIDRKDDDHSRQGRMMGRCDDR